MIGDHIAAVVSTLNGLGMTALDTQVGPGGQKVPYVLVWGPLNPHTDLAVSGSDDYLDTYIGITAVAHSVPAVRSLLARAYNALHGVDLGVTDRAAVLMHRESRMLDRLEATSAQTAAAHPLAGVDIYDLASVPA